MADHDLDNLVKCALAEDLGPEGVDITSLHAVTEHCAAEGRFIFREHGVFCGAAWLERVFHHLDARLQLDLHARDGDELDADACVAVVAGNARAILAGERTALNILSRLSGIATMTRAFALAVEGTRAKVYDTRKTTPMLRNLEKQAVAAGGGCNHRMGLYDQVLIKDNHIAAADVSPAEVVRKVRAAYTGLIEVEVDRVEDVAAVARAGADVILLDNMSPAEVRSAVDALTEAHKGSPDPEPELEVSGGVTLDTARAYAQADVDRISVGALTHSVRGLDVGLDFYPR